MINRRDLFILSCCAGLGFGTRAARSHENEPEHNDFACLTPQFSNLDRRRSDYQGYVPFSDGPGETLEFQPFPGLKTLDYELFTAALASAIWTRDQSLEPTSVGRLELGVGFLDGTEWQQSLVMETAAEWTTPSGANIEFVKVDTCEAQIRVLFETRFNQSAIGNQALHEKYDDGPTMWLGDVDDQHTATRRKRVIRHEFGHAIGCRHEHIHTDNQIPWDEDAIFNDLKDTNWSNCSSIEEQQCREAIRKFITGKLVGFHHTSEYNEFSIMHYPIKNEWTSEENFTTPTNTEISPGDLEFVSSIYP